jgi:hypothetical protein
MKQTTNHRFQTRDIHEAAAILASGVKFLGLKPADGYSYFVFEGEKVQEVCSQYWAGELKADLKRYSDALRTLKDRLYAR